MTTIWVLVVLISGGYPTGCRRLSAREKLMKISRAIPRTTKEQDDERVP